VEGPLSQLHAELDPENGGRFEEAQAREVMLSGTHVNSLDEYRQFNPDMPTVFPVGEYDEASGFTLVGMENPTLVKDLNPGQIWSADATETSWQIEREP
jgi:hypothetical protein